MSIQIISILQIILGLVGTWLFVYDLIWGFARRNRLPLLMTQLKNLEVTAELMITANKTVNYTALELQEVNQLVHDTWGPQINAKQNEIALFEKTPFLVANLAVLGLILVTLSGALQVYLVLSNK